MSSNSHDSDNNEDNKKDTHELILSNTSLRKIFHLGYNSRLLTKNIVNSIKFQEVINNIIEFASSDELTVRTYGPLILGLVRIYDKKLKLILEEVNELTKSKASLQLHQDKKEDRKKALLSKKKQEMRSDNKGNINLNSITNSNSYILTVSPMKEGVFSLMNNYSKDKLLTPSKPNLDLISQDSKEVLRATIGQQFSISQRLLSSNKKTIENQIQNPELNLSDNNQPELNNFFDFINDANDSLKMNNNLQFSGNNKDRDISNIYDYSGSNSQLKKVSFKDIENALKEKHKTVPYTKRNAKLEYDEEEMEINLEPDYAFNKEDSIIDLAKRLKKKLQVHDIKDIDQFNDIKYDYLYPDLNKTKEEEEGKEKEEEEKTEQIKRSKKKKSIINEEEIRKSNNIQTAIISKKRISIDSFDLDSTVLINNLSRLSLDKKDFSNLMSFNEKLEQIKELKEVSIDLNNNNDINEQFDIDFNNLNDNPASSNHNKDNDSNNQPNINELSSEIHKKILKKKKSVLFIELHSKIKVQYDNKSELLYDLLTLAQKGEFDLYQETMFDNNTITISKN